MTKVFDVRVIVDRQPHYVPAAVEMCYNNGVQTTTFRLSPASARLCAAQLCAAAGMAEGLHQAACAPSQDRDEDECRT